MSEFLLVIFILLKQARGEIFLNILCNFPFMG